MPLVEVIFALVTSRGGEGKLFEDPFACSSSSKILIPNTPPQIPNKSKPKYLYVSFYPIHSPIFILAHPITLPLRNMYGGNFLAGVPRWAGKDSGGTGGIIH